jgi:hypothetical protein
MNTFSRVTIALVGMTSLVAAQPKAVTKPAEVKPADAKPADAKAPAMAEMKPPQELTDAAKAATGTWKCKGQGMDRTMKMTDMTGSMKVKLAVDNWWMHASFDARMGKEPFHFESYTTFDAGSKKWKRVMVESGGGWATGESAGTKDSKTDWDVVMRTPMGELMFRDHEDMSDIKAGLKNWGEMSMDKGRTWTKVYEMTCKK